MTDTLSSIRPLSLHEEVAVRLRTLIFEHRLEPGQWVDEVALTGEWGISRTPLREALKVLAAEGLVVLHPRRGCRVVGVTEDEVEQLVPVMALLEGRCAHEATLRASDAELSELLKLHEALEMRVAARDAEGYHETSHRFHQRVQALAGNRWLDRATGELRLFMQMLRGRQLARAVRLEELIAEQRALIDAMTRRDATRAGRLRHDHLMARLEALKALHGRPGG